MPDATRPTEFTVDAAGFLRGLHDAAQAVKRFSAKVRILTETKQRPECPVCKVPMVCRCTTKTVRYFYCPNEDCGESAKLPRSNA